MSAVMNIPCSVSDHVHRPVQHAQISKAHTDFASEVTRAHRFFIKGFKEHPDINPIGNPDKDSLGR